MPRKTTVIDGMEWEEQGPYCVLCGAHMGRLYNRDAPTGKCFINPHNYEEYGDNTCPECGQEHAYDERQMVVLNKEQLDVLRAMNPKI